MKQLVIALALLAPGLCAQSTAAPAITTTIAIPHTVYDDSCAKGYQKYLLSNVYEYYGILIASSAQGGEQFNVCVSDLFLDQLRAKEKMKNAK